MLGTLMKYEFKGMWQRLSVFYLAWLAIGAIMAFFLRGSELGTVGGLAIFAFVIVSIVAVIMTLVAIVDDRFNKNLLGDEGYFTMTLPVSLDKMLVNKTLSALVWIGAAYIFSIVGGIVFALIATSNLDIDWSFMHQISASDKAKITLIIFELLIIAIIFTARFVLKLYASICAGRQFNKHQGLMSAVAYIVYSIVESFVLKLLGKILSATDFNAWNFTVSAEPADNYDKVNMSIQNDPVVFFEIVAVGLLIAAVYYMITRYLMKNRLNLQ